MNEQMQELQRRVVEALPTRVVRMREVTGLIGLSRSTIYVSLEPCSHYGKTPPCADLIIEKQIPRIVIGCQDPFSQVAGRGIQKLRDAGREVTVGVLEKECRYLIRRFITFNTLHRPFITLKWAESADHFIDVERTDGNPVVLSSPLTSMLVHKRRAEADAIMIGTRTAKLDNPFLTVRNWEGKHPTRVVLDRHLTLPDDLHLFDGTVSTLVFTAKERKSTSGVEFITLDYTEDILPQILTALYKKKIESLFVEGGSQLLQSFIDSGLWDEIYIEKSRKQLGSGVKSPEIDERISHSVDKKFGIPIWHFIRNRQQTQKKDDL